MPSPAAPTPSSTPFIKHLASSDRTLRTAALSSLRLYIQRPTPLPPLEHLKLWKGLFYSMWLSDKPLTQQRLARELADLARGLAPANFLPFVAAFWTTIAREWNGIEALRMDKFLYLVRCYVAVGFAVVGRRRWGDGALLEGYLRVLQEGPLSPRDAKVSDGLRCHVVDVFVEELCGADEGREAPLESVLAPLRRLGDETLTRPVRARVGEALGDARLGEWSARPGGSERDDDEDEFDGFDE